MKRVCCTCKKYMGETEAPGMPANAVTHGFCEDCFRHFMAAAGMTLNEYLEMMAAPVVAIGADAVVFAVNKAGRDALGKDLPAIEGAQPGEVFECSHAKLPGGCGRTVHCSGCTLRNTVEDTLAAGTPHVRVPVSLNVETEDDTGAKHILISTEKRGGVVFLRIENAP